MLAAQSIYGTQPAVLRGDGEIAMGRRHYPSLPEDRFDKAPVTIAGGGLLAADLRLDNRSELCRELGLGSGEERSLSDADILGLALGRWQEAAVQRLVGDFAFAWWDARRRRLLLARDFTGQRPLHFHRGRGFVAFASMPKGLHALTGVPRSPSRPAASDFLLGVPESGNESFFEKIFKVPPGQYLVVDRDGDRAHRYWHPPAQSLRLPSDEDYIEAFRERFDLAVAARLRGTGGQVASHLSGGLDSSAVTATAARLMAASHGRVIAYTSVPRPEFVTGREGLIDEGPLAASVAELYPNIEHVRVSTDARSPLDSLARNAFLYERPYLNLCNGVWVDAIHDDVRRRGFSVLLTGSLGNASFSYDGMPRLAELLRAGRLPTLVREMLGLRRRGFRAETLGAAAIGPLFPGSVWRLINRALGRAAHVGAGRAELRDEPDLIARAAARRVDWSYQPRRTIRDAQLWMLGRVDFGNYNKGTLGGWGIDVRDPSADQRLVEFCLSVPPAQFLAGGMPRALARRGLADRLPRSITHEFRKGSQGADWYEGLDAARGQLREEIAAIARDRTAAELLDIEQLQGLVANWPAPDMWENDETIERYRTALLRAVSMGHFLRNAAGTN
ncbi:MAG TPA: asparagine synthase-related protein [Sphingomonadaceae bacterium]|nr:asparagine synthase-related protein [Sphingomonadaceae bacterium]